MSPPRGGEFVGSGVEAFADFATTTDDVVQEKRSGESSLARVLTAHEETAGHPFYSEEVLAEAVRVMIDEGGMSEDEALTSVLAFTTQLPGVNAMQASERGAAEARHRELVENDPDQDNGMDNGDEADGGPQIFVYYPTTTDDVAASFLAEASRNEAIPSSTGRDEAEAEDSVGPPSESAQRARELVAGVLAQHQKIAEQQAEQQRKLDLIDEAELPRSALSVVEVLAQANEVDFTEAIQLYRLAHEYGIAKQIKPTETATQPDADDETAQIVESPAEAVAEAGNDSGSSIFTSGRAESRAGLFFRTRQSIAAVALLSVAGVIGGGVVALSPGSEAPAEASDEANRIDEAASEFLDDLEDGNIDDNDASLSDDVVDAYVERSDRQAEDGYETVEDFFPAIEAVGETVTNYQECITYINQQYPVEERLPEAYLRAATYALMKYSSDGYLENESRLNPDMQGLFAQSPEYVNQRFRQIVGEEGERDFDEKMQSANQQDQRTLKAFRQLSVKIDDIQDYTFSGLSGLYEVFEADGIDPSSIPPEYERTAIKRIFIHSVKDSFGENDRIAAVTDSEERGIVTTMLEEIAAGETATIDRLDAQSWNQGRMAAAQANPVDCSRETLERLLG